MKTLPAADKRDTDLRKICMGNHWDKNFDRSYLSEERRYGLLTYRYGYKALHLMRINKFWMIFKITLCCCSISYPISIPAS